MKWRNVTFKSAEQCLICKKNLEHAGVKTGDIFRINDGGYWCFAVATEKRKRVQKSIWNYCTIY